MSTTAQTTAADLALALRATLAPLRGSSGASRRSTSRRSPPTTTPLLERAPHSFMATRSSMVR